MVLTFLNVAMVGSSLAPVLCKISVVRLREDTCTKHDVKKTENNYVAAEGEHQALAYEGANLSTCLAPAYPSPRTGFGRP